MMDVIVYIIQSFIKYRYMHKLKPYSSMTLLEKVVNSVIGNKSSTFSSKAYDYNIYRLCYIRGIDRCKSKVMCDIALNGLYPYYKGLYCGSRVEGLSIFKNVFEESYEAAIKVVPTVGTRREDISDSMEEFFKELLRQELIRVSKAQG